MIRAVAVVSLLILLVLVLYVPAAHPPERFLAQLRAEHEALLKTHAACAADAERATTLGPRSESTYLNIVGGLLTLLLGKSPSGMPYSSFLTQEAIISAMVAHHGNAMGITERTLQAKFALARRNLQSTTS